MSVRCWLFERRLFVPIESRYDVAEVRRIVAAKGVNIDGLSNKSIARRLRRNRHLFYQADMHIVRARNALVLELFA